MCFKKCERKQSKYVRFDQLQRHGWFKHTTNSSFLFPELTKKIGQKFPGGHFLDYPMPAKKIATFNLWLSLLSHFLNRLSSILIQISKLESFCWPGYVQATAFDHSRKNACATEVEEKCRKKSWLKCLCCVLEKSEMEKKEKRLQPENGWTDGRTEKKKIFWFENKKVSTWVIKNSYCECRPLFPFFSFSLRPIIFSGGTRVHGTRSRK